MEASGRPEVEVSVGEVFVYLCWGGQLEGGENGVLSYLGGRSDCVWITQGMTFDEVVKVVEATIDEGLRGVDFCIVQSMIGRCCCRYGGMGMWGNC